MVLRRVLLAALLLASPAVAEVTLLTPTNIKLYRIE